MGSLPLDPRDCAALERADAARVRLADAIDTANQASDHAAAHATEAIVALIPRYTDPEEGQP